MSSITIINDSDLITNGNEVINQNFTNLNNEKIETSYIDTDTALTANSDSKIATQKAVKAYVDAGGNVNASETSKGIVEEATDGEVTAGTATGATGAKLFVTPTKLATRLNSPGVSPRVVITSTSFETSTRFTSLVSGGTNSFGTFGLNATTSGTTTRCAGVSFQVPSANAGNIFIGSPVFTTTLAFNVVGTTGSAFFGIGSVTVAGTGHTFTTDHCGFKVLISGSVASLYASQGDGTTESASSALTTLAADDQIDLIVKMNGTSSVDYFWQKNGTGWSSSTNLTSNMPNTASTILQYSVSNNSTASESRILVASSSYSR